MWLHLVPQKFTVMILQAVRSPHDNIYTHIITLYAHILCIYDIYTKRYSRYTVYRQYIPYIYINTVYIIHAC